jgi:hypothetical protein
VGIYEEFFFVGRNHIYEMKTLGLIVDSAAIIQNNYLSIQNATCVSLKLACLGIGTAGGHLKEHAT